MCTVLAHACKDADDVELDRLLYSRTRVQRCLQGRIDVPAVHQVRPSVARLGGAEEPGPELTEPESPGVMAELLRAPI